MLSVRGLYDHDLKPGEGVVLVEAILMSVQQNMITVGSIDPAALQRAKETVEQLRWLYIREWAPEALNEMEAAVLALRQYSRASEPVKTGREAVLQLSHDMKGQAGTLGLDLLADFAASIHAVVSASRQIGAREGDVCLGHIMAMRTALRAVAVEPDGVLNPSLEKHLRRDLRKIIRKTFN